MWQYLNFREQGLLHALLLVTVLNFNSVKQRLLSLKVIHHAKLLLKAKMRSLEPFGVANPT